jgi:hypothetical protein
MFQHWYFFLCGAKSDFNGILCGKVHYQDVKSTYLKKDLGFVDKCTAVNILKLEGGRVDCLVQRNKFTVDNSV